MASILRSRTQWPQRFQGHAFRKFSSLPSTLLMSFSITDVLRAWVHGMPLSVLSRQFVRVVIRTLLVGMNLVIPLLPYGQIGKAEYKLAIQFQTSPPCCTYVDILDQGKAPILFSIEQMRNLNVTILRAYERRPLHDLPIFRVEASPLADGPALVMLC